MLYNLTMYALKALSPLASLLGDKAGRWYKGRKGLLNKTEEYFRDNNEDIIWFHCASLGEFEQGRQLIEDMRREYPSYKILLTFFSPSGYDMRCNYPGADYVLYLPIDTPCAARRFVGAIRPKIVIFVKYEFWRNMLCECRRIGAQVYVVSAIFRPSQPFFKCWGASTRKALKQFNHFFVQNEKSKQLLASIGLNNTTIAGDTRFDRVYAIASNAKKIEELEHFTMDDRRVVVAGSTWPADDELLLKAVEKFAELKFVIVPHEINKTKTESIIARVERMGRRGVAYSNKPSADALQNADVLLLDTVGLLSSTYGYGDIAYIGGGFGVGIHNTLEAATFGLPIAFGPNYERFAEAVDLINLGGAKSVASSQELTAWIAKLLIDGAFMKDSSESNRRYVSTKVGACKKICNYIKENDLSLKL